MPDFSVRVTPYEREGSAIRGLASIYFANGMAVNNVAIYQGKENLLVTMPSYKTGKIEQGKPVYKDICHPVTAKFRDKLNGAILQAYDKALEAVHENPGKESVSEKLGKNKHSYRE